MDRENRSQESGVRSQKSGEKRFLSVFMNGAATTMPHPPDTATAFSFPGGVRSTTVGQNLYRINRWGSQRFRRMSSSSAVGGRSSEASEISIENPMLSRIVWG